MHDQIPCINSNENELLLILLLYRESVSERAKIKAVVGSMSILILILPQADEVNILHVHVAAAYIVHRTVRQFIKFIISS